jgi:hypothetical protein
MKYELINPSDKIEFEAESNEIAFFCVVMLEPRYAAQNLETEWSSGIYLFGITEEVIEKELNRDIENFCELYRDEINACFKSFHCVGARTSMNDICKVANAMKVKE